MVLVSYFCIKCPRVSASDVASFACGQTLTSSEASCLPHSLRVHVVQHMSVLLPCWRWPCTHLHVCTSDASQPPALRPWRHSDSRKLTWEFEEATPHAGANVQQLKKKHCTTLGAEFRSAELISKKFVSSHSEESRTLQRLRGNYWKRKRNTAVTWNWAISSRECEYLFYTRALCFPHFWCPQWIFQTLEWQAS